MHLQIALLSSLLPLEFSGVYLHRHLFRRLSPLELALLSHPPMLLYQLSEIKE